jgi:mono/diheme cytochrome c family protein
MRCPIVFLSVLALMVTTMATVSCGREYAPGSAALDSAAPEAVGLPGGDLAGGAQFMMGADLRNPLEGQPAAVASGKRLFVQMNCAGCHNYSLAGGMGPNLSDRYWRYGGTPAAIYQSIAGGRPQGMPAWYKALPPQDIWQLVTYIESYGGTTAPAAYHAGLQGDVSSTRSRTP